MRTRGETNDGERKLSIIWQRESFLWGGGERIPTNYNLLKPYKRKKKKKKEKKKRWSRIMANGPNSSLAPLLAHVLLGPTESQTFTENVHNYIYF
jgi:hypothetical protein